VFGENPGQVMPLRFAGGTSCVHRRRPPAGIAPVVPAYGRVAAEDLIICRLRCGRELRLSFSVPEPLHHKEFSPF
jgi:hypothetical protein